MPQRIRIILLEREAHLKSNPSDSNWFISMMGEPSGARYECLDKFSYKWQSTLTPILKLEFPEWNNVIMMVSDYARIIGKNLSLQDQDMIINLSQDLINQSRLSPLLVLLVADGYLRDGNISSWNTEVIFDFIVSRYKKYWMNLCHNDTKLLKALSELLVYSTINGEVNITESVLPKPFDSAIAYINEKMDYDEFKNLLCFVNETDNFNGVLYPLEPDIIGESFVLQFIHDHWHNKNYIMSLLTDTDHSIHFFARCCMDFNESSIYKEVIDEKSYIWIALSHKWNFAKIMLEETDWVEKLKLMNIFKGPLHIHFDNSIVFRAFMVKEFFDTTNKLKKDFSLFAQQLIQDCLSNIDSERLITISILMDCKRKNGKDTLVYLEEGAQYLKESGFPDEFCTIGANANLKIRCDKSIESQILEIISAFSEMILDGFYSETYKIPVALYLLNNEYISNNFYDDYSIIRIFNEFVILMEHIYIDCEDCEDVESPEEYQNSCKQQILRLDSTIHCLNDMQKYNKLLAIAFIQGSNEEIKYYFHKLWNE